MSGKGRRPKPTLPDDEGNDDISPFGLTEADLYADGDSADDHVGLSSRDASEEYLDMDSPLEKVPVTGNAEKDVAAQLNAFQEEAKKSLRNEIATFEAMFETEYWFCVCFQSRDQKEAFLDHLGLIEHGDKYLDGYVVAEKLKVPLPPAVPISAENKINKTWLEFVEDV